MATKIEVQWWKEKASLAEIYQKTGIEFAFLSSPKDGYRQCHPWAKCCDFLHDALRSTINKDSCQIYGFNFDAKKNPLLDLRRTRMLVRKNAKKGEEEAVESFHKKMLSARRILNFYEDRVGVTKTTLRKI